MEGGRERGKGGGRDALSGGGMNYIKGREKEAKRKHDPRR